ncbi:MAG: hypothetical protein ABI345_10765 [Jatrophihabitans sp.]
MAVPGLPQGGARAIINNCRCADAFRYVPPGQVVARAATYIEEVLLKFSLSFSGSLLIECADTPSGTSQLPAEDSPALQVAGAALDLIADGLFVSSIRGDEPRIESSDGHRFTHQASSITGPRTRRFVGQCVIELPAGPRCATTVSGSLQYTLEVTASAPSDPVDCAGGWSDRYDRSLASIGAVVLAPVAVSTERAARLYPVGRAS